MAKLTKLTPVLVERTCEHCGDGVLKFKKTHDDGFHIFRKTKYWYEYECEKCGAVTNSDKHLKLQDIVFVDEDGNKRCKYFQGGILW